MCGIAGFISPARANAESSGGTATSTFRHVTAFIVRTGGAGAAFRALAERHGAAEITEVRRQTADWQRQATRAAWVPFPAPGGPRRTRRNRCSARSGN